MDELNRNFNKTVIKVACAIYGTATVAKYLCISLATLHKVKKTGEVKKVSTQHLINMLSKKIRKQLNILEKVNEDVCYTEIKEEEKGRND